MFFCISIYNIYIYLAASATVGYVSVSKNISKAWCCFTSTESSARFLLVVLISGQRFYTNPEAVFSHFCVEHHFTISRFFWKKIHFVPFRRSSLRASCIQIFNRNYPFIRSSGRHENKLHQPTEDPELRAMG